MSIGHRCDLSVEGSFNVGMFSFSPSVLPPQNWIFCILNWIIDLSHLPVNKGTKRRDLRLGVAKYFVLYELVHTSLNLIS